MCLDPHLNKGCGWRRETGLSPPENILLTFQGGTSFMDLLCVFFSVLSLLCIVRVLFICAVWSRAGKWLTS